MIEPANGTRQPELDLLTPALCTIATFVGRNVTEDPMLEEPAES
jgi:hypothetical protein